MMFVAVQDPREKKFNSSLAGGVVGEKKFKKFPRQETGQESLQIFSSLGPVSSRQNVQIPRHVKENVIIIHPLEF